MAPCTMDLMMLMMMLVMMVVMMMMMIVMMMIVMMLMMVMMVVIKISTYTMVVHNVIDLANDDADVDDNDCSQIGPDNKKVKIQ